MLYTDNGYFMNIRIADTYHYIIDIARRFRDIRFTGQVVFAVIVLLISWSGIKTIQTNYVLQKQISALKQQNAVADLQNKNTALQNEYFKTNDYLELSARRNFGLGMPGETELLVPEAVALSYVPELPQQQTAKLEPTTQTSNWQAWINFFLNRPQR